ncbi:hypothetical protein [Paenibacillus sp. Marseille-Q4541]|uniref:hypothetical protein n=1 Tax=Paenibacillus sp. Marseille-Q4541 TaxID=2831522 RepID=UPI001BA97E42|nr:hypothetical protein [Paenibacillus sp. Marseille-Q4541]
MFDGSKCENLKIDDVTEYYESFGKKLHKRKKCKSFKVLLSSKLDIEYCDKRLLNPKTTTPFKRITEHKDIIAVILQFSDGSKEEIEVAWCENSDVSNKYQNTRIDDNGDLYIVVSEEEYLRNICSFNFLNK